jgi:hypothetical protein
VAFVGIYLIFGLFTIMGVADAVNEVEYAPIVCNAECERFLIEKNGN